MNIELTIAELCTIRVALRNRYLTHGDNVALEVLSKVIDCIERAGRDETF